MTFHFFPIKMYRDETLTFKGKPTIILWTNLVGLDSSILYTKSQPQSFLGSGEEDF